MSPRASWLLLVIIPLLACQMTSLQPVASPVPATSIAVATEVLPSIQPGRVIQTPQATLPTLTPTAPKPVLGTVKETLRVRALPSTNSTILDRLNPGDTVQIIGRTAAGDWLQIHPSKNLDMLGWVSAEYVNVAGSIDALAVVQPGASPAPPTNQAQANNSPGPTMPLAGVPTRESTAPSSGAPTQGSTSPYSDPGNPAATMTPFVPPTPRPTARFIPPTPEPTLAPGTEVAPPPRPGGR